MASRTQGKESILGPLRNIARSAQRYSVWELEVEFNNYQGAMTKPFYHIFYSESNYSVLLTSENPSQSFQHPSSFAEPHISVLKYEPNTNQCCVNEDLTPRICSIICNMFKNKFPHTKILLMPNP